MNDSDINPLVDAAVIGRQVEDFLNADIGRYLVQRIEEELDSGFEDLMRADPDSPSAVRKAQNRVWRANSLKEWLEEAVTAGLRAQYILEERQQGI